MNSIHDATRRRFEAELAAQNDIRFDLTLFVNGASDLAARAIANARQLCDVYLAGRAELMVVDVHADVELMLASGVVATPTLVKNSPLPIRRIVGDLSQVDRVLTALDLPRREMSAR
ncbi:MAG: circadian clock protein KaiB [Ilumatobacteraceae bacterium]|nr:circadian clock protein KaiB [Ilumatobacteraceae bacterium]